MRSAYLLDLLSTLTNLFGKDEEVMLNQILPKTEVSEDEIISLMLYDKYVAPLPVDLTRYYTLLEQSETGMLSYAMFVLGSPSTEIMQSLKNPETRAVYKRFSTIISNAGGLLAVRAINQTVGMILNNRYAYSSKRIMEECVRALIKALAEKSDANNEETVAQLHIEAIALIIAYAQVSNYERTIQKSAGSACH